MHPSIARHRTGISAICQRYRIRRPEGSVGLYVTPSCSPASTDAESPSMQRDPRASLWDVQEFSKTRKDSDP